MALIGRSFDRLFVSTGLAFDAVRSLSASAEALFHCPIGGGL